MKKYKNVITGIFMLCAVGAISGCNDEKHTYPPENYGVASLADKIYMSQDYIEQYVSTDKLTKIQKEDLDKAKSDLKKYSSILEEKRNKLFKKEKIKTKTKTRKPNKMDEVLKENLEKMRAVLAKQPKSNSIDHSSRNH